MADTGAVGQAGPAKPPRRKAKPLGNGATAPLLNRDQILGADDLQGETVDVPEWGGKVRLRVLSLEERLEFEDAQTGTATASDDVMAHMVARSIVGPGDEPLFKASDIPALKRKSSAVVSRLFERLLHLNGMTDSDIEELAGNSPAAPSDGTPTP